MYYWINEGWINNPRLYNGKEIHFIVEVDLEEIAKRADLKGSKKNKNDDEYDIPTF